MKTYNKTYGKTNVQEGPVSFQRFSANRKLSPSGARAYNVCSTYVSIEASCPNTCPFKNNGCYAQSGHTGIMVKRLDKYASEALGADVNALEAKVIDQQWEGGQIPQDGRSGGRDLRLHVAGDVANEEGAVHLAGAAERWLARGGGAVWTYTHRWRDIRREAWGPISVFASVESVEEAAEAQAAGYKPALTVVEHTSGRAWSPFRDLKVIPCPAQTRHKTCVECRLCLDSPLDNYAVSFAAHGSGASKAKRKLQVYV